MRTEVIGVLEALGPNEQHLQRPVHHVLSSLSLTASPLRLACGVNERRRRQVDRNFLLPFIRVWLPGWLPRMETEAEAEAERHGMDGHGGRWLLG